MRKAMILIVVTALMFLGMVTPAVFADMQTLTYESDTRTIEAGSWLYWDLAYKNTGTLYFTINVGPSDPEIDVFVVTRTEYNNFKAGYSFNYFKYCSDFSTTSYSVTCDIVASGSYVLVFDNSDYGEASPFEGQSATMSYTVNAKMESSSNGGGSGDGGIIGSALCLGLVLLVLIIVIPVAWAYRKRRKGSVNIGPPPSMNNSYRQPTIQPQPLAPRRYGSSYDPEPPPPSVPRYYREKEYEPPEPAVAAPERAKAAEPGEAYEKPPHIELPSMMGGTRGTLDTTYSSPPKPKDSNRR